jgi:signal transduction histidine kinase
MEEATTIPAEKTKPFRLVKYFTLSSLIVIFVGTLVLSAFDTHLARKMQLQKSEEYAKLLIENLNHQIFLQFILPAVLKYNRIQLSNPDQFQRLDQVVRSTLHSFKVEMVNIYDMHSTISYSFDKNIIGRKDIRSSGYKDAIEGKSSSRLVQRGNFYEIMFGFPKDSHLITISPLRAEKQVSLLSGPVLGAIEIKLDLTEEYKTIFNFQIRVIITSAIVMIGLFLVLLLIVKNGEAIIERRARERLRLKEQLNRAEHLSSLGEMVAAVSHEIRNPLGIILSSTELMQKKMDASDPANTLTGIIREEADRLNTIITDFLNFARPRTPNLSLCRVDRIIDKNITFLAPQIQSGGYTIGRRFAETVPEIHADADMLYQAFLNILINAMQAMPDNGSILVVVDNQDNMVNVSIEDSGPGIPAELAEKIWDPFFTTKDKGTGLGLGIVKNIVKSHNGNIVIENLPAGGTRVAINLPVMQGEG